MVGLGRGRADHTHAQVVHGARREGGRGGEMRGGVRGPADQGVGSEQPTRRDHGEVALTEVDAVDARAGRPRREGHIDAVVDHEDRAPRDDVGEGRHPLEEVVTARLLVAELHDARSGRGSGIDDLDDVGERHPMVGDEVQRQVVRAHAATRPSRSAGSIAARASRNATANDPGPLETASARSDATAQIALAVAAAVKPSLTASSAAIAAPRAQPPPVTRVRRTLPPDTRATRSASTIRSTGPETATVPPVRIASARAASSAASGESVESTPRPPAPAPARARISDAFAANDRRPGLEQLVGERGAHGQCAHGDRVEHPRRAGGDGLTVGVALLGGRGSEVHQQAPPIPAKSPASPGCRTSRVRRRGPAGRWR